MRFLSLFWVAAIVVIIGSANSFADQNKNAADCEALLADGDRKSEAVEQHSEALRAWEKAYSVCRGAGIPAALFARSADKYAWVLVLRKDLAGAESTQREAIDRIRRERGPNAPELFGLLCSLADTLDRANRFEEALEVEKMAVTLGEKAFGASSGETAKALVNVGYVYQVRKNDSVTAEWYFRKAIDAARGVCPARCSELSVAYKSLYDLVRSQPGRQAEAEAILGMMEEIP